MERAKSDEIIRSKCVNYVTNLFGGRVTQFYAVHTSFAKRAADLAVELYSSRDDEEYVLNTNSEDIVQRCEVIWAAALLSYACYAGDASYDDVCDVANPEVADYIKWVNPDKSISLLASTQHLLSQLHTKNTCHDCGPIFVVLARALAAVEYLGSDPYKKRANSENTAFASMLWNVYFTIDQLARAQVYKWSPFVARQVKKAYDIIVTWKEQLPPPIFRSGDSRSNIDWILTREVPSRVTATLPAVEC